LAVQVGYLLNLALVASKRIKAEERDTMWFGVLPMAVYARISGYRGCVAFAADFAPQLGGFASVVLLVAALHNSWEMTLIIVGR
jgi:hypothetical protein